MRDLSTNLIILYRNGARKIHVNRATLKANYLECD